MLKAMEHDKAGFKKFAFALTIALALAILLSRPVNACINYPSDLVSIEVVLNKPGVNYDLSPLESMKNVISVDYDMLAYRSHVSDKVKVVVSLQRIAVGEGAPSYIAVRVQPPAEIVNLTEFEYTWSYRAEEVPTSATFLEEVAKSLGWKVELTSTLTGDAFRAYLTKKVENGAVMIYLQGIQAKRGYDLYVNVRSTIESDTAVKEVERLISRIVNEKVEVELDEHSYFITKVVPGVDSDIVKEALIYELKWLSDIGVIKGLSENDINEIGDVAEVGYAGWNSRIVYAEGKWMPYNIAVEEELIAGAQLIRGLCEEDLEGKLKNVPGDPPTAGFTYQTNVQTFALITVVGLIVLFTMWYLLGSLRHPTKSTLILNKDGFAMEMNMDWIYIARLAGIVLIAIGALLILLPGILKLVPSLEKAHPLLWYTFYRKDGLVIGTSPILIIIGVTLVLLRKLVA